MEIAIVFWLLFGMVAALVASSKGRSGCAWFILGFLLGPFGLIVALLPSSEANDRKKALDKGVADTFRKCPHCAEPIRKEARICKYCRSEVEPI